VSVAFALAAAALVCSASSSAAVTSPPPVDQILAAYESATGGGKSHTFASTGTLSGDGLTGDFSIWRDGDDERDDERLGPRAETTLRIEGRTFVRTANGNVRELTGYLRRRERTATFIDSGDFVHAPERSRFVGYGDLGGARAWRLEVRAAGGEPETVWIDVSTGLLMRIEYLDGDGSTTIDFSDWRTIAGRRFPFRLVTSDGDRAFDVVQQTTSIAVDAPIAHEIFSPLRNRTIAADGVQTVPLLMRDAHIACRVAIAGKPYEFVLDTGAQSVLLDSRVAAAAGLTPLGALEVRGTTRVAGLHVLSLPRIDIGSAHLDDLVATSIDLRTALGAGTQIDGILGVPFFASSVVELDFAHHTMRFGPPGSFVPRGQRVALDLDRGLVEGVLRVNRSIDAPFMIDTGNSGELLLYRSFVHDHPGIVPFGTQSGANFGIGGAAPMYRSSLDEIRLGDVPLYHPVTDVITAQRGAFADRIDAGNVGLGILKNFVVTFDLANGALYLREGDDFDDGRLRTVTIPS
jgi:predicted aspartyl protease